MAASHPHIPTIITTLNGNLWIWGKINNNDILESPLNQQAELSCVVHSVTRASYYREKIKRFRQGQNSMGLGGLVPIFDRQCASDFATVCTLARTCGYMDGNGSAFHISAHHLTKKYNHDTWVSQLEELGPFPVGIPMYDNKNLQHVDGLVIYCPPPNDQDKADTGHAVTIVGHGQVYNENVWVYEDSYGLMGALHGSLHGGYGIIHEAVEMTGCFTYI